MNADQEELLAKEYAWADRLGQEIRDADQARTSAEQLQRQRARVIAEHLRDFWDGVKFTAEQAAKRLGDNFHFESLPDDPNSFVIRRASAASLSGKVNGESITMICTRTEDAAKPHSDPPVRFTIDVGLDNKLYLKHLGERIKEYEALEKMLRAAFLPQ